MVKLLHELVTLAYYKNKNKPYLTLSIKDCLFLVFISQLKKKIFVIALVGVLFFVPQLLISQNYWSVTAKVPLQKQRKLTVGSAYLTLDQEKFEKEFYGKINQKQPSQITLINEKGIPENFDLQEAPLLSKALAKKFHKLKNYTGKSTIRPDVKLRLSISPQGVSAWMRLPNQEDYFIQPVRNAKKLHFSYLKKGQNFNDSWQCKTLSPPKKIKPCTRKK